MWVWARASLVTNKFIRSVLHILIFIAKILFKLSSEKAYVYEFNLVLIASQHVQTTLEKNHWKTGCQAPWLWLINTKHLNYLTEKSGVSGLGQNNLLN